MKKQLDQQQAQMELQSQQNQQQMEVLLETLKQMNANSGNAAGSTGTRPENSVSAARPSLYSVPSFTAFDSTAELWTDYYSRFLTFIKAHSVPETKIAQISPVALQLRPPPPQSKRKSPCAQVISL